jgi:hypothetical protein
MDVNNLLFICFWSGFVNENYIQENALCYYITTTIFDKKGLKKWKFYNFILFFLHFFGHVVCVVHFVIFYCFRNHLLPQLSHSCNNNCSCSTEFYEPLCTTDMIQYFSPCHAGCHNTMRKGEVNIILWILIIRRNLIFVDLVGQPIHKFKNPSQNETWD